MGTRVGQCGSVVLGTESIQTVELSLSVSESNNKMQLLQMIKFSTIIAI